MRMTSRGFGFSLLFALITSVAPGQGWLSQDIGATAAGSTNISAGVFTINGNGGDIYGTADAFRYVYLEAEGDCEIQARVVSTTAVNGWAKAGVMIRQDISPGSQHAHMNWNPGYGFEFQYRGTAGAPTNNLGILNIVQPLPRWIRLAPGGKSL